jgi:hypothetical protein
MFYQSSAISSELPEHFFFTAAFVPFKSGFAY